MHKKRTRIAFALSALLALAVSSTVIAAEVSKSIVVEKGAEASFDTVNGCTDEVLGVSISTDKTKGGPGDPARRAEIFVFGSFVDNCEFGGSTSFSGTVPLNPGEYVQYGVNSGTLVKTFVIDGNEIQLSLAWTGKGEISSDRSRSKAKEGNTRIRSNQSISTRSAAISGSFVVNGLERISGNTITNGSLNLLRNATTTRVNK